MTAFIFVEIICPVVPSLVSVIGITMSRIPRTVSEYHCPDDKVFIHGLSTLTLLCSDKGEWRTNDTSILSNMPHNVIDILSTECFGLYYNTHIFLFFHHL